MSKSLYAIGGMGLAACLLLSLMMRQLLKVKQEGGQPAIASAVDEALGARLTKPVVGKALTENGHHVLQLKLSVFAGLKREDIAQGTSNLVWRTLAGKPGAPDLLRVVVDDELGAKPCVVESPPPKGVVSPPVPPPKSASPSTPPASPPRDR